MRMRVWLVLLAALPLLTVGSGATAGTSAPPQNGLIAACGGDGIYLIDAQRTKAWKVPGTDELGEPAWSPDGSLLAVEGWEENGNNVYTIEPDGSDRRLVLENAWSPSWSPDGTRLVVVHGESERRSAFSSPFGQTGATSSQLTFDHGNDDDGASEPVWSPDGKWIAFVDGDGAVKLVSPNGADDDVRTIADRGGTSPGLRMGRSLPSRRSTRHDYRQEIVVFDLATGQRTTLLSRQKSISSLAWSPDGKQLAFLSSQADAEEHRRRLRRRDAAGSLADECRREQPAPDQQGQLQPALVGDVPAGSRHRAPSRSRSQASSRQPKPSLQSAPKPSLQSAPKPKPSAGSVPTTGTPSTSTIASNVTKSPRTVPKVVATATTLRALGKGLIAARGRDAIYLIDPRRWRRAQDPGDGEDDPARLVA